ncbi:TPA: hypothetical protein ACKQDG_001857, partial [Stenotrophomonas maltophilia]
QSMFSAAIRCSAPLVRASAVVGLVVMPASGRHYHSKGEAQRSSDRVPAHRAPSVVVPAAGRQPHDLRGDAWLPASGRHYQ